MKKIIFGSAAAICVVVGLTSFKKTTTPGPAFWFVPASGTCIMPNPTGDVFENPNQSISGAIKLVAVSTTQSTITGEPDPCTGITCYCHIGFTATQVTGIGSNLRLKGTVGQVSINFSLTDLE